VPEGGSGDERFEDFFIFEYQRLVGALRLVTGDADRATDAVDEACARAWEQLARGRSIDALGAWIRVVAFNVARDRHRRRRSERLSRDRIASRAGDDAGELGTAVAMAVDVRSALAQLPRQQREVVVSFYFLDHPVETIALDLDIPTGTVKSILHRARAALAELLGDGTHGARKVGHA
jgi:RNA polymerase sigma-70 factor (ECF subfamily)